jgi:hypothetical protein
MLHSKYMLVVGLFISTPALAAYAPSEPATSNETIIVTGQKPDKATLRRETSAFVKRVTALPDENQYARRNEALCAVVTGIDDQYASRVSAKIAAVAEAVGLEVMREKCKPNLLVQFTADSNAYLTAVKKSQPRLLAGLRPEERLALFASQSPVRWWYSTESRDSGGQPIRLAGPPAGLLVAGRDTTGVLPTPNRGFLRSYSASQIDTQLSVNLATTIVVVDVEKATGFPLDSVAAYATMVSLAQIKLSSEYSSFPSILGIFKPSNLADKAPRDLTEWDYAYLRALYKIPSNRTARVQRTQIFSEMVKQLAK